MQKKITETMDAAALEAERVAEEEKLLEAHLEAAGELVEAIDEKQALPGQAVVDQGEMVII